MLISARAAVIAASALSPAGTGWLGQPTRGERLGELAARLLAAHLAVMGLRGRLQFRRGLQLGGRLQRRIVDRGGERVQHRPGAAQIDRGRLTSLSEKVMSLRLWSTNR